MAPTLEVTSSIDRVTVHRTDALVRRVADVSGQQLPVAVRVAPLPLTLHPATVRGVVVDADGGLLPTAASVRVGVASVGRGGAERPDLERAMEDARRAVDAAAAEIERLRTERAALIEHLVPVPRERARAGTPDLVRADREPVPSERRLALLRFADEQLALLSPQLVDAERVHGLAGRTLAEATDRWQSERREAGRPHELTARADVTLQGDGVLPDGARLELTYLVSGATWRPSHRLHLDGERSAVTLGAVVVQQTGEDWSDIALELSTSEPRLNWDLPELKPVRVGRAARAAKGWREPEPVPDELFADFDRAAMAAEQERAERTIATAAPASTFAYGGADPITAEVPAVIAEQAGIEMSLPAPAAPLPPAMPALAPQAMPTARAGPGRKARVRGPAPVAKSESQAMDWMGPDSAASVAMPPEPDRPDASLADLDGLALPAASNGERGRPRVLTRELGAAANAREAAASAVREITSRSMAVRGNGVACVYRVPGRVDILSSRSMATVVIDERPIEPTDEFVAVPYQAVEVFRTVVFTNPFTVPVLGGPIDVVGPDGYLGPAELETLPLGARARLGVGVEEAIGVERQVELREDAKGLRRNNRSLVHDVVVRVTNRSGAPASVVVRERVPIVPETDDRITVEERAVDPPWATYERHDIILRGGRQWQVVVDAASSIELRAEWEIIIPTKHELEGGNRR